MVLSLASSDVDERSRAFDTLVALYWRPLYKYARAAWGRPPEDCEDLTQNFFARILESGALGSYDRSKATFRTFLRLLFERQAASEVRAEQRIKRGGAHTRLDFDSAEAELGSEEGRALSPEELFQKEWVRSVFALAIERLREVLPTAQFEVFEAYDLDEDRSISYRLLAERFGIPETTVTNHLSAARRRFRELVLDALREATASDQEYRDEARALLGVEA